jgi:hypothetical protein
MQENTDSGGPLTFTGKGGGLLATKIKGTMVGTRR